MMEIVVSGVGVVSALGIGAEANLSGIRSGRTGISPYPEILCTENRIPVGELKRTNQELKEELGLQTSRPISRTALLGTLAVREAMQDAGIRGSARVGLVSSTSVGGMDLTEHFFRHFMQNENSGRLREVRMHDCSASTSFIAEYCGIEGYTTTLSTACSSAANAIIAAARLLRHGIVDCVLAGGTDALSAFTLNGFKSLMILDEECCRPFDQDRAGLNLGEGAGYLVLQRREEAQKVYCTLSGYANRNDAHHQTASSEDGEGAYLAMHDALQMAGLDPAEVDYVNVHGTGTGNNDLSESRAMIRLFGDHIPSFSSTKVYTGHTLAAAGGIEAVYSALSVRNGYVYPTLNFRTPMAETGLVPNLSFQVRDSLHHVLSNSFGFGGNCSSLLFSR